MKKTATALAAALLAAIIFQPLHGIAEGKTVSDIEKELNVLQKQAKSAEQKKNKAAEDQKEAEHYKAKTEKNLQYVMEQMTIVSNRLSTISLRIENTKEKLNITATELAAAEERIVSREQMIESRVRLMYTNGNVSYIEVLLSSTSFVDFLERADALKTIVDQDQNLLDEHKKDKALVIEKKQELEQQYAEAEELYAEMETQKSILQEKEAEKQVLIAEYNQQIEDALEITEEQEQQLVALASKRSDLEKTKDKLKAEEAARKAQAAKEAAARRAAAKASTRSTSSSSSGYTGNGGPFLTPVNGARVSSGYGRRTHPVTGEVGKMHTGLDLAVSQGTPIYAAESGTVILAEWWSGYGNAVMIDHGGGVWTLYGHIRNGGINVSVGQQVSRGQKIAEVGSTGQSTGPHLHFEVRINGSTVDPVPYL